MPSAALASTSVDATDLLRDLTDLFENASVGLLILGPDGTVERANRAAHLLSGRPPGGSDTLARTAAAAVFAEADWIRLNVRLDQDGVVRGLRVALRQPEGDLRPALIDANVGGAGGGVIRVVVRPVFDRRPGGSADADRASWDQGVRTATAGPPRPSPAAPEPAVAAATERLRDFLENVPVSIHQVSPQGLMVRANREQLRVLGHDADPAGFLGQDATVFYPVPAELQLLAEAFLTGEMVSDYDAVALRADGRHLPVTVYTSPVAEPTEVASRCFLFLR
ncbi:PAS domain S-box protein [Frankia sp. AgKG'84/4]|uniref:PAS domain S-box protein n=1 Tax=Frankia sp. AgKG'84/4 TaxID=573490 RepID=UPI00200DCD42|nr:PAS domain-containing protein [Frankia sp. AgKG'84/4]MCL9794524.1 PAS domain-containing protein [Frankia sp. AgKG'84/4]